jgi:uncharacterized protein
VKRLFVDTGAFIARSIARDGLHDAATKTWSMLARSSVELHSTDHVFDETMTLLARLVGYPYAATWGELHLRSTLIEWHTSNLADLEGALALMKKYADQEISFTDCMSFHWMKKKKIKDVFGYDKHFRLPGFSLLGL